MCDWTDRGCSRRAHNSDLRNLPAYSSCFVLPYCCHTYSVRLIHQMADKPPLSDEVSVQRLARIVSYLRHHHCKAVATPTCVIAAVHVYDSLTNKLTPRSRALPEKLTVPQRFKKFSTFYGARRFINAFTKARHVSLP